MPRRVLEEFKVEWFQVLDEQGILDSSMSSLFPSVSGITGKDLHRFYESMLLIRAFDEKCLNLQRAGRLGTCASCQGQEAIHVGCAEALQPSDWFFPAFRESGISLLRGVPLKRLFQYWSGDERGSAYGENQHDFPVSIAVGTHIPHAVGAAWGAKFKGDPIAVLASFGDGATSKGDFHEGLNFAGVFKLPVVFVCQNNQWAISVPLSRQTASATLAQKAVSYGFEGIQVDGNDVVGVYAVVNKALEKARSGGGPTFVECLTYRLNDHTTADDASRYRSGEEVVAWRKKDPVRRLKSHLEIEAGWTDADEDALKQEIEKKIKMAVDAFESAPDADSEGMFNYLFASLDPELIRQKERLHNRLLKGVSNG